MELTEVCKKIEFVRCPGVTKMDKRVPYGKWAFWCAKNNPWRSRPCDCKGKKYYFVWDTSGHNIVKKLRPIDSSEWKFEENL